MIGPMRAFFGPTRFRASPTKLRGATYATAPAGTAAGGICRRGPAHTRSRAGHPAQVNSLGVGTNSPESIRAIAADSSASSPSISSRANVVETTASARSRKRVDDLDLVCPGPEAGECVHEPLQAIVVLDDLVGRVLRQRVRLVVEHERLAALTPQNVEPAVQQDAVVLERERTLGPARSRGPRCAARAPTRSRRRRTPPMRASSSASAVGIPLAAPRRARARPAPGSRQLEQPVHGVADLGRRKPRLARADGARSSRSPATRSA